MIPASKPILEKIVAEGNCLSIPCKDCPFHLGEEDTHNDCITFDIVKRSKELLDSFLVREEFKKLGESCD